MHKAQYQTIWRSIIQHAKEMVPSASRFINHLQKISKQSTNKDFSQIEINQVCDQEVVFAQEKMNYSDMSSQVYDFFLNNAPIDDPEYWLKSFKLLPDFGIEILQVINAEYEYAPDLLGPELSEEQEVDMLHTIHTVIGVKKNFISPSPVLNSDSIPAKDFFDIIKKAFSLKGALVSISVMAIIFVGVLFIIKLNSFDPLKEAEIYYSAGNVKIKAGEFEEAIINFSKAIDKNSNFAQAYLSRGKAYFQLKKWDTALNDFNSVLRLNQKDPESLKHRGLVYHHTGKFKEAIDDYNMLISLKQESSDVYYYRGLAYYNIHQYVLAIADYSRSIELNPDNKMAVECKSIAIGILKTQNIKNNQLPLFTNPEKFDVYFGFSGKNRITDIIKSNDQEKKEP